MLKSVTKLAYSLEKMFLCKARTGKAKSMSTVLKNNDVYHVRNAIKLGQYNVGREGKVLTVPLYMGFLVKDKLEDSIIPDIDLSSLDSYSHA